MALDDDVARQHLLGCEGSSMLGLFRLSLLISKIFRCHAVPTVAKTKQLRHAQIILIACLNFQVMGTNVSCHQSIHIFEIPVRSAHR